MKKRWIKKTIASVLAGLMIVTIPGSGWLGGLREVMAEDNWEEVTGKITNGDFESDLSVGWKNAIDWDNVWTGDGATWTKAQGGENNNTNVFHYSANNNAKVEISQTITGLEEGTYKVELEYAGGTEGKPGLSLYVNGSDTGAEFDTPDGWDTWKPLTSDEFTLDTQADVDIIITGTVPAGYYGSIDNVKLYKKSSDSGNNDPVTPVTFRLYYYDNNEEDTPLYIDIWKHTGLEFSDTATTANVFNWKVNDSDYKKQATLTQDSTDTNWYYTEFEIVDSTKDEEGFDIYSKNSSGWKEAYAYSTTVYTELISGDSDTYYLKDGVITTTKPEDTDPVVEKNVKVYYYYDGTDIPLYADLWKHTGLEFGDDISSDYTFGWTYKQGQFKDAEEDNWKYITLKIKNAEDSTEGIDIYDKNQTPLYKCSYSYNNSETYKELVSGENEQYYIVGSRLFTTLDAAKEYLAHLNSRSFTFDTTPVAASQVESDLYVEKVPVMNDFITGFDVSSYLSIRNSGAAFKDYNGNVLSDQEFFNLLKESGVNYIRIRTWVDPYDSNGNSYGGGACDLDTAIKIGQWASNADMKVLVDFHYSDFWTDPSKYSAPKAWQGLTLDEKAAALQTYTENSLSEMLDAGVDVGMVQVGNETTNGFCGESDWENMCKLFNAGSHGIQNIENEYGKKIMIAIHFTNPEKAQFDYYAMTLDQYDVEYDVFATSYYPYWHGTLDNLTQKLSAVADTYGKYVMVAETSYARTYEDGDGHVNTVYEGKSGIEIPYPVSLQGQALSVRNVVEAVANVPNNKGIGVFYWEPAWIPVQVYDSNASDAAAVLAQNQALWEKYGSGWASSYSAAYDEDAGRWYGGSAVDNESVFDFDGTALETLKIFNMVRGGTTAKDSVLDVMDTKAEYYVYEDVVLPETVDVMYASGKTDQASVTWSEKDIAEAVYAGEGEYPISGVAVYNEVNYDVICTLTLKPKNYLVNPSFEDPDISMWIKEGVNQASIDRKSDGQNYRTGTYAFHFYSETAMSYTFYQTVTVDAGIYNAGCFLEGGNGGDNYTITFFVKVGDEEQTKNAKLNGWLEWQNPEVSDIEIDEDGTEITIGVRVTDLAGEAWGAFDDFYLNRKAEDVEYHILEGEESEWTEDEEGNIVIISDGPFVKFQAVKVDGKVIDSSNYTAKKGSTIITFLKSYLDTLAVGMHEVEIVFTNGSAYATINVVEKETTETTEATTTEASTTETTTTEATTTEATTDTSTASTSSTEVATAENTTADSASTSDAATPKASNNDNGQKVATGDAHKLGLLIVLLLISASGLVIADLWKKKR